MNKILVVSDTHGDDTWLNLIKSKKYDYIIHAGDHLMGKEIKDITPFYVDGNNDWSNNNINIFSINNQKIVLLHGDEQHLHGSNTEYIIKALKPIVDKHQPQIIIYGHTHIPFIHRIDSIVYLNPGSMWFSRHDGTKTYLELELNDSGILNVELNRY